MRNSVFLASILRLLISCDDALFNLILNMGAPLVGTGLLWWTYADLKRQLDETSEGEILRESVQNESAFLVYSILATIITVNLFICTALI
jgi:solute carrier family 44 protein 1 (choline transporter-like protein)